MLNIFLQTVNDVVSILSIESVSVVGLLLLIIVYLVWHQQKTDKKHEKEKESLKAELIEAHEKLDQEYQKSTDDIKNIIEKYYTISTKVLETLNNKL